MPLLRCPTAPEFKGMGQSPLFSLCFHRHRFWGPFHSGYPNLGQVPPPPPRDTHTLPDNALGGHYYQFIPRPNSNSTRNVCTEIDARDAKLRKYFINLIWGWFRQMRVKSWTSPYCLSLIVPVAQHTFCILLTIANLYLSNLVRLSDRSDVIPRNVWRCIVYYFLNI